MNTWRSKIQQLFKTPIVKEINRLQHSPRSRAKRKKAHSLLFCCMNCVMCNDCSCNVELGLHGSVI